MCSSGHAEAAMALSQPVCRADREQSFLLANVGEDAATTEPPGGAGLETEPGHGPVPGFPTSLAAPMWTRFSMDSANTAASQPTSSSSCDDREDRGRFRILHARKLAEAGIPLDRSPRV